MWMSPEEKIAWVKSLKAGDSVLYHHSLSKPQIRVVKSVHSNFNDEIISIIFTDEPNMCYNYHHVRPLEVPPTDKPLARSLSDFIAKNI